MRKRKSREQIKPTMTNEQLQEFISAGINQSSIDARVNQGAIGLASDFKSKVEQRRGHDKGHEPVGGVGLDDECKNDLRLPGVEPIEPTPSQLLARKAYRDGSLRFSDSPKRTKCCNATLGNELERLVKENKAGR